MRTPRKKAETGPVKRTHYITDKSTTEINGVRLTKDHHKNGIELTDEEALHYVAAGAVSTSNPADDKAAEKAVADKTERTATVAKGESDDREQAKSGSIKQDATGR